MALCPGWWAGTRKVELTWILLKQETVSGSGISWAICKSASRCRHITTPAPHHSVFYRPDALPATQPTASKRYKWSKKRREMTRIDSLGKQPLSGVVSVMMNWYFSANCLLQSWTLLVRRSSVLWGNSIWDPEKGSCWSSPLQIVTGKFWPRSFPHVNDIRCAVRTMLFPHNACVKHEAWHIDVRCYESLVFITHHLCVWPGGVMVRVLARDTKGRRFDSRPFHFQVTTLGKLFTHKCLCHQAV